MLNTGVRARGESREAAQRVAGVREPVGLRHSCKGDDDIAARRPTLRKCIVVFCAIIVPSSVISVMGDIAGWVHIANFYNSFPKDQDMSGMYWLVVTLFLIPSIVEGVLSALVALAVLWKRRHNLWPQGANTRATFVSVEGSAAAAPEIEMFAPVPPPTLGYTGSSSAPLSPVTLVPRSCWTSKPCRAIRRFSLCILLVFLAVVSGVFTSLQADTTRETTLGKTAYAFYWLATSASAIRAVMDLLLSVLLAIELAC